ncbi:MAG: ATP-dependent RecD-like DNA helicase [Planctomycetota bacterium]|nr:MAG: ATP-dependent RecD-like DNA helicase [Planctomycetota bacterium]
MTSLFDPPSGPDEGTLAGTVAREVYRSPDGGFSVVRLDTEAGEATVTGPLPPVQEGETLEAEGEWVHDPRHGRQFKARSARVKAPTSADAVARFLASGAVEGVGPALAERIVNAFGDETLAVLSQHPERLLEVQGIGKKKLRAIAESWEAQRATREVMLYLRGHGLGPALADKVYQRFGADAVRVLDEDPYVLAREIEGAGFLTADRLARALGFAPDDPRRLRAGLLHVAHQALAQGSTAVPAEQLLEQAAAALHAEGPGALEEALHEARAAGHLELDAPEGEPLVYLPGVLRAERGAARLTAALARAPGLRRLPALDVEAELAWLAEREGLALSPGQREALRAALSAPLAVVTGGPGVGKTTVVRSLVALLRRHGASFALAAPTGRAAKRLEEATGAEASTVHRLLEWDPHGGGFARDASAPLDVDLLVVDEASMLDVRLYHAVVRALPPGASLVLIGDRDQLPSVGPGNVLADLMASGAARVVELREVFRQAASSRIVLSAHEINRGRVPDLSAPEPGVASDFFFVPREDPQAAQEVIVRLVKERIPARYGLDPFLDVQVLAPMHKGVCGTEGLNAALKRALNPPDPREEASEGRARLDVGDKVMQLRNDYENEVFNGDVGRVVHTEPGGLVVVDFEGREVSYARSERSRLALAYCATVHKAQGSEYPAVVVPVLTEHFVMLERNLLYTAMTRARRLVVLVGQRRAVELAVGNDRPRQRLSALAARVRAALSAP